MLGVSPTWRFSGGDSKEAARRLADLLKMRGMRVIAVKDFVVAVETKVFVLMLMLDVQGDPRLVDRIVGVVRFELKSGAAQAPDVPKLLQNITDDVAAPACYERHGFLYCRADLTFVDELSWRELEAFLTWFEAVLVDSVVRSPLAKYLK